MISVFLHFFPPFTLFPECVILRKSLADYNKKVWYCIYFFILNKFLLFYQYNFRIIIHIFLLNGDNKSEFHKFKENEN